MLEITDPQERRRIGVKRVEAGGKQFEVFTIQGVEYVRGSPVHARVLTSAGWVELRRRDSVAAANALCSIHKSYRAVRKPRTSCPQCQAAYAQRHEEAE